MLTLGLKKKIEHRFPMYLSGLLTEHLDGLQLPFHELVVAKPFLQDLSVPLFCRWDRVRCLVEVVQIYRWVFLYFIVDLLQLQRLLRQTGGLSKRMQGKGTEPVGDK